MGEWLAANLASVLIALGLVGIIALVVLIMRRDKKKGKSSCGCGCENCPMSGSCHKE